MEITLQYSDEIYKNFILGLLLPIFFSIPAIAAYIKCKYEFTEYKLKYKLLWIIPAIFLLGIFIRSGLFVIDYSFDRTDIQTVYVENVRGYNGGCYLYSEKEKFRASNYNYSSDENIFFVMEEEVLGHICEIESYKSHNNIIRIKVLD